MNALARKEIRLLLPAWVAALLVATMPMWPWREVVQHSELTPVAITVALLAVALSSFGLETSHGTFGLLLVQPVERRRFWRIKSGLLALALASVWCAFAICIVTGGWEVGEGTRAIEVSALLALLAFSGGLWTTLLLRDMVSSLFCAFLVPSLLCAVTIAAVNRWREHIDNHAMGVLLCSVLGLYAVAGFFWARRLFYNAQDLAWTGGQVSLTSTTSLRWLSFRLKARQNRWTALVKKELQLQEVMVIVIPIFLLLHVVALASAHYASDRFDKEMAKAAVPAIWLMTVPWIIGCVAVAEERRLNTQEGLLCLPASRRGQFAVKFAVALILGIVLGGIVPWALALRNEWPLFSKLQYPLETAAAVTLVAFYASTMSRSLLQAIPTTLCISFLGAAATGITAVILRRCDPLLSLENGNMLFPALTVPVMAIALVWLSFRNFKQLQTGCRLWAGNFLRAGVVYSCAVLAAMAVFDRFWQHFEMLEAPHGPARLSGPGRAQIGMSWQSLAVLLPDGRLWIGQIKHIALDKDGMYEIPTVVSGGFAQGADWAKITATVATALALKSDGTLWTVTNKSTVSQFGSDADWAQVSCSGGEFMAVKQNGTLWRWDYNVVRSHDKPPRTVVTSPVRVGNESDWTNIFILKGEYVGVKCDGSSVWAWNQQKIRLKIDAKGLSSVAGWNGYILFLRDNGSLWALGLVPSVIFGQRLNSFEKDSFEPLPLRVGTDSDWISLSGEWQIAALEANGTLWASEPTHGPLRNVRPSRYSDWLAAAEAFNLTLGLARDGTVTCWNEFGVPWPDDNASFWQKIYLGPSRRPVFSTNILEAAR